MLYNLLYPLHEYFSALNVFRYITFRAAYATVTALFISFILGPWFIRLLRRRNVCDQIREDVPERHEAKRGTPTMGGWMVVIPVVLVTGVLNLVSFLAPLTVSGLSILLPLFVLLSNAALGAYDDWKGIRDENRGGGLRPRTKFIWLVVIALVAALGLKYGLDAPNLYLPNFQEEISSEVKF